MKALFIALVGFSTLQFFSCTQNSIVSIKKESDGFRISDSLLKTDSVFTDLKSCLKFFEEKGYKVKSMWGHGNPIVVAIEKK